jgi:hypothetical protein
MGKKSHPTILPHPTSPHFTSPHSRTLKENKKKKTLLSTLAPHPTIPTRKKNKRKKHL